MFLSSLSIFASEHVPEEVRKALPRPVGHYLATLPKIDRSLLNADPKEKPRKIVDFMRQFPVVRNQNKDIPYDIIGVDDLADKLCYFMRCNSRILMSLSAFPFKSLNTEKKVLSFKADLGDLVAILTLNHISCEISRIYEPGASIFIFSDGVAFKKILPIRNEEYWKYQRTMQLLVMPFAERLFFLTQSERVYRDFARKRIKTISLDQSAISSMTIFAREEMKCSRYSEWKETKNLSAKSLGSSLALHSRMFNEFLKERIPGYRRMIHLSVRPYTDISEKLGISLIYLSMGTPWHCVLVMNDRTVYLRKLEDIYKDLKNASKDNADREREAPALANNHVPTNRRDPLLPELSVEVVKGIPLNFVYSGKHKYYMRKKFVRRLK